MNRGCGKFGAASESVNGRRRNPKGKGFVRKAFRSKRARERAFHPGRVAPEGNATEGGGPCSKRRRLEENGYVRREVQFGEASQGRIRRNSPQGVIPKKTLRGILHGGPAPRGEGLRSGDSSRKRGKRASFGRANGQETLSGSNYAGKSLIRRGFGGFNQRTCPKEDSSEERWSPEETRTPRPEIRSHRRRGNSGKGDPFGAATSGGATAEGVQRRFRNRRAFIRSDQLPKEVFTPKESLFEKGGFGPRGFRLF